MPPRSTGRKLSSSRLPQACPRRAPGKPRGLSWASPLPGPGAGDRGVWTVCSDEWKWSRDGGQGSERCVLLSCSDGRWGLGALGVRGGGRVALWDEWSVGRGRGFGAGRGDGAVLAPSDTSSGRCWVVGTAPPICVFEKVSKYGASDWLGL